MNRFADRKYLLLFITLMTVLGLAPFLEASPDTRLVFDLLLTLVFFASIGVIFADRRLRYMAVVLGIPTLVGGWTGYFIPGLPRVPLVIAFHLFAALFFAFTVAALVRGVHREKDVSADALYAALCGYILLALGFGHLFCVVAVIYPGSFAGETYPGDDAANRHFVLTYFSFVTLTTVGYGDVLPKSPPARGLAMVEAVTGQFYLAVLVAELIGKRLSTAQRENARP